MFQVIKVVSGKYQYSYRDAFVQQGESLGQTHAVYRDTIYSCSCTQWLLAKYLSIIGVNSGIKWTFALITLTVFLHSCIGESPHSTGIVLAFQ